MFAEDGNLVRVGFARGRGNWKVPWQLAERHAGGEMNSQTYTFMNTDNNRFRSKTHAREDNAGTRSRPVPTGIPSTAGHPEKHAGCPTPNSEKNAGASLHYQTNATEVTVLTPLQHTKRCSRATASASGSPASNPDRRAVHRTLPNVTNGCRARFGGKQESIRISHL